MTFSCSSEMLEGKQVFSLFGKLRFGTTTFFQEELLNSLDQDAEKYAIDLRQVTELDCKGLGVLVDLKNKIQDSAKVVEVIIEEPHVRELIVLAKLDKVFTLTKSA